MKCRFHGILPYMSLNERIWRKNTNLAKVKASQTIYFGSIEVKINKNLVNKTSNNIHW